MEKQTRLYGLDFVRAVAMLLGLVLHVCTSFMPTETYHMIRAGEYSGDPFNLGLLNFIHLFRMQLFFLMAGFFAELVIDRRGISGLLVDRIKRIIIPFIFAVLFMIPIFFFINNVNGSYSPTLDEYGIFERFKVLFFWGALADKPIYDTPSTVIHYWFIFYLIVIYLFHFTFRPLIDLVFENKVIKRFAPVCFKFRYGVFLLGLITLPFQYSLTNIFFPPSGYDAPLLDVAFYGLFYFAGVFIFKCRAFLKDFASNCWFYFFLSIPLVFVLDNPTRHFLYSASVVTDITSWKISNFNYYHEGLFYGGWIKLLLAYGRSLSCWVLCLAFIGLAHKYLNKKSTMVRYLADSAYWVYWIHLPVCFGLAKLGQQAEFLNSLTKAYIILIIATFIVYWLYNNFVRYSFLGDYFMGYRKSRNDEGESEFKIALLTKKVFPKVFLIGVLTFCVGSIFDYNNSFQHGDILVESFVARKVETLEKVRSIDGIRDKNGDTPLHNAVKKPQKNRRYDSLAILLTKAKNVNPTNSVGRTPLFQAVRTGDLGDIRKLIEAGTDLNKADKYGHTPAHVAAIKAGIRIIVTGIKNLKLSSKVNEIDIQ